MSVAESSVTVGGGVVVEATSSSPARDEDVVSPTAPPSASQFQELPLKKRKIPKTGDNAQRLALSAVPPSSILPRRRKRVRVTSESDDDEVVVVNASVATQTEEEERDRKDPKKVDASTQTCPPPPPSLPVQDVFDFGTQEDVFQSQEEEVSILRQVMEASPPVQASQMLQHAQPFWRSQQIVEMIQGEEEENENEIMRSFARQQQQQLGPFMHGQGGGEQTIFDQIRALECAYSRVSSLDVLEIDRPYLIYSIRFVKTRNGWKVVLNLSPYEGDSEVMVWLPPRYTRLFMIGDNLVMEAVNKFMSGSPYLIYSGKKELGEGRTFHDIKMREGHMPSGSLMAPIARPALNFS